LRLVNRLLIRLMAISPLVQDGRRKYAEWKKRVEGRAA
jgi:hypothetical protein